MDYLIFAISFVAAFLFSLGGVGAAIIIIPILVSFGIPITMAKPVGLFYNAVSLSGASVSNVKNKRLDFKMGMPIIIFSFLFAIPGAYLSNYISEDVVLFVFIAFLIFSGLMFLLYKGKASESYREKVPFVSLTLIGALAGTMSGLLGIGGGGIISPLMLLLSINSQKITSITAFVVPFSSIAGFLTYWSMGQVDWHLLILISIAGIAGAGLGTMFMQKRLKPASVKKVLAVILLFMAVKMIYQHWL